MFGEFNKVKIENMTLQFMENNPGTTLEELTKMKKNGTSASKQTLDSKPKVIVTVPTDEMEKLFNESLCADYIINYSINGNPSIKEFLNAFNAVNSKQILLIVDDSNAILAANQAIELMGRKYEIIPISSNDISVSYLACKAYSKTSSFVQNIKTIRKVIDVDFGKIAIASKRAKYGRVKIAPNDYIGFINKKIVISMKELTPVVERICDYIVKRNRKKSKKTVIIFAGINVKLDDIRRIRKYLAEKYSLKTNIIQSGQKLYDYHIIM